MARLMQPVQPPRTLSVCTGLACGEAGGWEILRQFERLLQVRSGQVTPDGRVLLCSRNCFGLCAIGPNVRIDGKVWSGQDPARAKSLLDRLKNPENP